MDIMQAIIDIERKAQGIVDSVDELKSRSDEAVKAELAKKEAELTRKIDAKKEQLKSKYDIIRDKEMSGIERKYADKLEALDDKCRKGKKKWTDELVRAVIGE
ncbi:MAG: hypothetical protein Q4E94_02955 [Clostridia bacterium]|nr:hypothetical protein [Clostridia bacterium]